MLWIQGTWTVGLVWDHSYEALPPSPGSLWSTEMPRLPMPSSAESMPSSEVIDTDDGC